MPRGSVQGVPPGVSLSFAIQAHPRRADLHPRLLEPLAGRVDLVFDPEPNAYASAWRTYRRALEETPDWATHRVVIQDDAIVCRDFVPTLERAVAAQPDCLIVLCVCGAPATSAQRVLRSGRAGRPWAALERDPAKWIPAIAIVWPVALIAPALEFVDAQSWPFDFTADDEIVGKIARALGVRVLATVPSLVQHEDLVPSLVGRRARGGRSPSRVAVCFIDPECDPLTIDWSVAPI